MPIYEYRCNACGKEFERLGSMRDRDCDVQCPLCSKVGAEKLMSRCRSKVESSLSDFQAGGGGGCSGCSATSCGSC
ncbi:MAG: zinc ribbon domain-containing protein [Syntrophales bacterium]|nr:zinc ribbon domain-containing protein [Syntrophales bacterium]